MTTISDPIVLYGRPGCELCDEARSLLDLLLADRAARGLSTPAVAVRSIDDDDDLHRRYLLAIPVIASGGRELHLATGLSAVRRFLCEVLDGAAGAADGSDAVQTRGAAGTAHASGAADALRSDGAGNPTGAVRAIGTDGA